jgi:CheY-like chemotaxis protein
MRIIRFLGEDGRVHHGQEHADGTATVLLDPHGVLGPATATEQHEIFRGKHALVADDDANMREMMATVLGKVGCRCTVCSDGAEAMEAIERTAPDVVVSDIIMPHSNGYEIFAAARRTRRGLPVVLVTGFGYDPNHSLVRASNEGLAAVLYKPFTPQQLLNEIDRAVLASADNLADALVRCEDRQLIRSRLAPVEPTDIIRLTPAGAVGANGDGDPSPRVLARPHTDVTCTGELLRVPAGRAKGAGVISAGELAVVIGSVAEKIDEAEALSCVLGYTIANDITAPWLARADFNAPCALGPAVVTPTDIEDPDDLTIRTIVNGETVLEASTAEMSRSVRSIISDISHVQALTPGTVVLTGPPPFTAEPAPPVGGILHAGDRVTIEIEGIGRLANEVQAI